MMSQLQLKTLRHVSNCGHHLLNPYKTTFRFTNTTPIPLASVDDVDLKNIKPLDLQQLHYQSFVQHKDNPTGLVRLPDDRVDQSTIVAANKDTLKDIFKLDAKGYTETAWPPTFHKLVGQEGIAMIGNSDPKHKERRKLLNPFFMEEPLRDRFDVIQYYGQQFIDSLMTDDAKHVNIFQATKKFAFDVIFGVVFGKELFFPELSNELIEDCTVFTHAFMDWNMENLNNPDTLLGQGMLARERLLQATEIMILDSLKLYETQELDPKSIIYKMIDGKVFSDDDEGLNAFKENILNLVWAGHDTTAAMINNLIYILGEFDDHEFVTKLRETLEENKGDDGYDFDFIMGNELLDAFAKEVVRYIPSVTGVPKSVIKDGVEINGCPLQKGDILVVHNYITSKNENVWGENVDKFDPQRFIDDPPSKQVWYPFGLGTKMCIGWKLAYLEIKIVTAMLMEYEIELDQNTKKVSPSPFYIYDVYGRLIPSRKKLLKTQ